LGRREETNVTKGTCEERRKRKGESEDAEEERWKNK
jgi:hypothetical protein